MAVIQVQAGNTSPDYDLTTASQGFTIGAADVAVNTLFSCGYCRAIWPNASGNIAIKRQYDTAFAVYAVTAGQKIYGKFVTIGGTGSGSTAIAIVAEV